MYILHLPVGSATRSGAIGKADMKRFWQKLDVAMMQISVPEQYAGQVRAQQKAAFQQMLPFGLIASAANAIVLFAFMLFSNIGSMLWLWAGIMTVIAMVGARSGFKAARRSSALMPLSETALKRPVIESGFLGFAWGAAPALLLPAAQDWQLTMLLTVCAGMMAGGAYLLSSIPRAAATFVGIIAFCVLYGLILSGMSLAALAYLALFVCYSVVMVRAAYWNFNNHVRSWLQKFELEKQAQELLRQKDVISLLLKDFEETASDYLWEIDENGRIQNASEGLSELCQLPIDELNGSRLLGLMSESISLSDGEFSAVNNSMFGLRAFANALLPVRINGEQRWWNISGKPLIENDEYCGYRGVISDVTDARNAEARIAYLAHFDALTDLPNRANFNETMERCLYRYKASGEAFTVLFVDLDYFKAINDEHGHDVGDELLRRVGIIMKECVDKEDIVARIGGDEFAILCPKISSKRKVMALCDAIVDALKAPIEINGTLLHVGASVGGSLCPDDADTMSDLLKCADLALYRAKEEGRGRARFFEPEMDLEARERRKLESDLRTAFAEGQFSLHYQPLVDSQTKEVKAFETLLRWNHPERGEVSPESFINLTEQTGMIVGIGEWVIRTALAEASTWDTDARISINLSPIQVKSRGLVSVVAQALAKSGIEPSRIEFEITETVLLDDSSESIDSLHQLRNLGVHIALDDFGTGYSSLSYLRSFPFDKIKIDKSFVQEMDNSHECRAIVQAVAGLANNLGMISTAEGVETVEQAKELAQDGCTELQGFYFSRPKSARDLIKEGIVSRRKRTAEDDKINPPRAAKRKASF